MVLERGNLVNDYQRWLKSYMRNIKHREISKNTLLIYRRVLSSLESYLQHQEEITQLREIDKEIILSFMEEFESNSKRGRFSTKTKILYIAVLKSFFTYISDNNDEFYTYEREFKGILPKKGTKRKKVSYLSDNEVERILNYFNRDLKRHYDYIYALGVKLMLFSGLRISEVLNLRLENITLSDIVDDDNNRDFYEIHLTETKSKEEQTALIKKELIERELIYFQGLWQKDELIFKGKNGKNSIHRSNFYVSVNKILKRLEIEKRGLHIFRHTCAMQLFRKTGNLLVLKETLRHSDIKTTMIYAQAEKRDIARAMR